MCIMLWSIVMELSAQDMKDEIMKRFRLEIIEFEKRSEHLPITPYNTSKLFSNHNDEVLKVSPYTKLPTKGDRLILLHYPEDQKINLNLTVTNAPPINERPPGSISFQSMGGKCK